MAQCPSCGGDTPQGSKFCGFCGAPLSPGSPPPEGWIKPPSSGREVEPPSPSAQAGAGDTVLLEGDSLGAGRTRERASEREDVPHPSSPHPQRFGKYGVRGELGRGAMGLVYLARDEVIGRDVAVKTFRPDPFLSEEERSTLKERFLREARAAGALSHPNVVVVHDVG